MDFCEKYKVALAIIFSGKNLKDDTYVNLFLDLTGSVLKSLQDVEKFDLLALVEDKLSQASLLEEEQQVILIRLVTVLIKSVEELSFRMFCLVSQSFGGKVEGSGQGMDLALVYFYIQVFKTVRENQVEQIGKKIIADPSVHKEWSGQFEHHELNQATNIYFSHFLRFCLRASRLNKKPVKFCWFLDRIEKSIKDVTGGLEDCHQSKTHVQHVFDRLHSVVEVLDDEDVDRTIVPLIQENVDFHKIFKAMEQSTGIPKSHVTGSLVKCYIRTHLRAPVSLQAVEHTLKTVFSSLNHSVATKKVILMTAAQYQELGDVFLHFMDLLGSDDGSERFSNLTRYLFGFHTVPSVMSCCENSGICSAMFSTITSYLTRLAGGEEVQDRFHRDLALFATQLVKHYNVPRSQMTLVVGPTVQIARQRMRFSPSLRSDCLGLLAEVLRNMDHLEDLDSLLMTLCEQSMDEVGGWLVRDSALSCLTSLLLSQNLAHSLVTFNRMGLVLNTLALNRRDGVEVFIKTASLRAATALLENLASQLSKSQLEQLFPFDEILGDNISEIEKRELVLLASKIVEKVEHMDVIKKLERCILACVEKETDWEVKVNSVKFWRSVLQVIVSRNCDSGCGDIDRSMVKELEEHHFFTGLARGLSDYEECVRDAYYQLIKSPAVSSVLEKMAVDYQAGGKRKESEIDLADSEVPRKKAFHSAAEDDETEEYNARNENIEDILDESDRSIVEEMGRRKLAPAELNSSDKSRDGPVKVEQLSSYLASYEEQKTCRVPSSEDKLNSILDDIIQSSGEGCQIDLVDCY